MFPRISKGDIVSLDFETSGIYYWKPEFFVFGVSISTRGGSWYFDFRENNHVGKWLAEMLPQCSVVVAQNAQFEYQCFKWIGGDSRSVQWYCTMIADCLIYEHHQGYGLEAIAKRWGIATEKSAMLKRIMSAMNFATVKETVLRLAECSPLLVAEYCKSDARDALNIFYAQQKDLLDQNLMPTMRLEMQVLPVLADMSWGGVRVDLDAAHAQIPLLDEQERVTYAEIRDICGASFNVNSTKQVREFFKPEALNKYQWKLIDGTVIGPTKSGNPCLDQTALRNMSHPLAAKIMRLKKTMKLRDTFIKGHVIGSADANGYVHTQFNQTRNDADAGTVTGRLSSTGPALQQITKRDKGNAAILRAMFLPDGGYDWLCADYRQVDFRWAAHLINDPVTIAAYASNPELDYHQVVSDMTGIPRNPIHAGAPNTKQINLGLSFGSGAGRLAIMMGMPYELKEIRGRMAIVAGEEAAKVFKLYHEKLPGTGKFLKMAENVAASTGYVRTQLGRRLRFPNKQVAYKAAAMLFQSNAADTHKFGLVMADKAIRDGKLDARLMLSCHDEIGVSIKEQNKKETKCIVDQYANFMGDTAPLMLRVPILASQDFGPNWYEASKG
jgi:DNA polymerase I